MSDFLRSSARSLSDSEVSASFIGAEAALDSPRVAA